MASKIVKPFSFGNVVNRTFAAQAATAAVGGSAPDHSYILPKHELQTSQLKKGGLVASIENNSPIARISIFVKSGSKYETPENAGVSHMARLCAGLKNEKYTYFGMTVKTQQFGGNFICQTGREYMVYSMSFMRDNLSQAFDMLYNTALRPKFRHWEVEMEANGRRLKSELASVHSSVRVMEMLHKAAFRETGLGNSLFMPEYHIGKITPEQLFQFYRDTHSNPRLAFIGLGVDHKTLVQLAKGAVFEGLQEEGISATSAYGGGEIRCYSKEPLAYVAVAKQGAKIGSEEAVNLAVAQYVLANACPGTKYGSSAGSKLATAAAGAGGSGPVRIINANYTDSGLFGFFLVEQPDKVSEVLKAITKVIRSYKVTDAEVAIAKAKAKAALLIASETEESHVEEIGLQTLFNGSFVDAKETAKSFDRVTTASVQEALTNLTKGKSSMASMGNIAKVPYLDQF